MKRKAIIQNFKPQSVDTVNKIESINSQSNFGKYFNKICKSAKTFSLLKTNHFSTIDFERILQRLL
jgi:hypothetical protein